MLQYLDLKLNVQKDVFQSCGSLKCLTSICILITTVQQQISSQSKMYLNRWKLDRKGMYHRFIA